MKRCEFERYDSEYCVCKNCGVKVKGRNPETMYCECPGRRVPTPLQKAEHYASAVKDHVVSGFKTRTDEEVLRIYEICKACPDFSNNRCKICGCRITTGQSAFTNKLRMKTQKCPNGKWE